MLRTLVRFSAIAAACASCATVSGMDQYVAIDSVPRGLELLDARDEKVVIGKTPLVLDQDRAASHEYVLRDGDMTTRTKVPCDFRFGESLAANLIPATPFLMFPPPVGPAAAGVVLIATNVTDLTTGSGWQCPEEVRLEPGKSALFGPRHPARTARIDAPVEKREPCARYAIAPPTHKDEAFSREIAARLQAKLAAADTCGSVVDPGQVARFMRRYNVSNDHPLDPFALSRSRLNELAHHFGVTHVVVTEVLEVNGGLKAQSATVDLFKRTMSEGPAVEIAPDDPALKPASWLTALGRGFVGGLPNLFVLQPSAKFFDWKARTGYTLTKTEFALPVVAVLVNFNLTQLDHPAAHDLWEIRPELATDLVFQWNGQLITTADAAGNSTTRKLDVIEAILPIAPRLVAYTPLGQFAVWGGIGPGLTLTWGDGPLDPFGARTNAFIAAGARWSTFVTDALSIGVSITRAGSLDPHVQRAAFELSSFTSVNLDIGYFIPELKTGLRSML